MTRARRDRSAGRSRSRRGSVYVLVLASAATLALIGLAAATITRTQIRTDGLDRDTQRASRLAVSAAHAAIAWINQTPDWRERLVDAADNGRTPDYGHFKLTAEAGGAECKWWFDDGNGGPINPKAGEPVRVVGLGRSGRAQRVVTATLESDPAPACAVLRSALHATGALRVEDSVARDGPISSNSKVSISGAVTAAVEAPAVERSGTLTGSVLAPAPTKVMPPSTGPDSPFERLVGSARPIVFASLVGGRINRQLLGPAHNPVGTPHAEGLYAVRVPAGGMLRITDSRILGTLVVELGKSAGVLIDGAVLWDPAVADLPALVVVGPGTVEIAISSGTTLSESTISRNLNPTGAPYAGVADSDTTDIYPSRVRGLIYVAGGAHLSIEGSTRIHGCVLVDGTAEIDEAFIRADPALAVTPPRGFDFPGHAMRAVPGSWRQVPFHDVEGLEPIAEAVADAGK